MENKKENIINEILQFKPEYKKKILQELDERDLMQVYFEIVYKGKKELWDLDLETKLQGKVFIPIGTKGIDERLEYALNEISKLRTGETLSLTFKENPDYRYLKEIIKKISIIRNFTYYEIEEENVSQLNIYFTKEQRELKEKQEKESLNKINERSDFMEENKVVLTLKEYLNLYEKSKANDIVISKIITLLLGSCELSGNKEYLELDAYTLKNNKINKQNIIEIIKENFNEEYEKMFNILLLGDD